MNKIFLLAGVAVLALTMSESRAAVTCQWKEGSTTELVIYGDGQLNSSDCPSGYKSTVETVTFDKGSNITSIGTQAFYHAHSLKSIDIPDSVTTIGEYAFANTNNLNSITIPDSVTRIDNNVFSNSGLTNLTILAKINAIPSMAFYNASNLTSITIPDSVTLIDSNAFTFASKLSEINCLNTKEKCYDLKNTLKYEISSFNEKNYKEIKPKDNCNSYSSSGCAGCKSGYGLVSGACEPISCPDGFEWKNGECKDKYPYSRKHWTPAEANQWLYDDNNTITITFKKQ